MATENQNSIDSIDSVLEGIPNPKAIRSRIAENLQERLTLRQLLKLSEQKKKAASIGDGAKQQ